MHDLIKSFSYSGDNQDQEKEAASKEEQKKHKTASFSGLDAITSALRKGMGSGEDRDSSKKEEGSQGTEDKISDKIFQPPKPSKKEPETSTQSSAASAPKKTAVEDKEKASETEKASLETRGAVQYDATYCNKLYMRLHKIFNKVINDIKQEKPIDPNPLLEVIPELCEAVYETDYLFTKAFSHKRYATWIVSHSVNVAIIALKISIGLKYDKKHQHQLAQAALLHDVGMTKIPNRIIFKHGKLSDTEFATIKKHPDYSRELLKHLKKDYPYVFKTAYQEQEREDGSGYPQGLKGPEITEYAKIVGMADVFEALVHGRSYREGYIPYRAIQKIIENLSKKFNPKIIRAFINVISMFPVGSMVKLNTGEIAQVISVNKTRPIRPVVEVLTTPDGEKLDKTTTIDLEKEPLIYISDPVE